MNRPPVFRDFQIDDLESIDLHETHADDIAIKERFEATLGLPWCLHYSVLNPKGELLAITSGLYLFPRVMEISAMVDRRVARTPFHYAKAMKFLLHHEFERLKLERMQILIKADEEWAFHWQNFLGFKIEGTLQKYGADNVAHYMCAKVR